LRVRVQYGLLTCTIVFKNLIRFGGKSRPWPRVSNNFVPAPIISIEEYDFDVHRPGVRCRLSQAYLSIFIFSFGYLHLNTIYMISDASSIGGFDGVQEKIQQALVG